MDLTDEQVDELVEAALGADSGCIYCVGPILRTYRRLFPDVDWAASIRRCAPTEAYSADAYISAMTDKHG